MKYVILNSASNQIELDENSSPKIYETIIEAQQGN